MKISKIKYKKSKLQIKIQKLFFLIFYFLFLIFNFSPANAQPVFSPGSPAPWDSLDVEPGAVIKDGNIFKMWYTGSDNKKHRIGYAVSKDGVKWERNDEIVFDRGEEDAWDSFSAAYPCVIKDGNVFKMWYTGSSGKILSIGYAVSKDGIKWERRKSPVFEPAEDDVWDGFSVMYPMVIKSENKYMLWYTGSAGISYKIGTAVSDDGIKWKRLENKPIDLGRVHSFHPWVIKEQGQGVKSMLFTDKPAPASSKQGGQEIKYKMWYSVKETPKSAFHIFSAESKDGVKWNIKGEALKPDMGWDIKEVFKPVVLHDGRNYKLWYAGFDGRRTRVGLAVSTDLSATARAGGNKWIRHKENPVLDVAEGSGWDGESVFRGSIMREENLYKMWYSGFNGRRTRIGMASSKDGINWQKALLPVFSPGADWDRLGAGYPFILKEEKTYKMWYTGFNGTILQIGYAESIDGTNWKRHSSPVLKPYKDKGQVAYPYVIKDSGKYRMYYVAYGKDAVGIETALSKDGINWERQTEKPIITENTEIMSPWVVKDSNGYKMWYSVYGEGGYEIHLATSRDGVKWEKHGAVLKPDGMIKSVSGPMVFKEEEQYKMWYEEFNGSKTSIALAFSKDGINWQRFEGHTAIDPGPKDGWDSFGVAGGWVLKEQGQGSVLPVRHRTQTGSNGQEIRYKMWYSGHDGETLRIGYAESKDGKDWERFNMPVFDRGTEGSWDDFQAAYPFVMKDGDGYKMWYYGYGKTPNHPPGIGYATSIDGVHWQRYKENPVLSPGEEDSWDNEMLGYPVIIKEDSLYKMWYAGTNRFEEWKIGYAESKDGINWTKLLAPVVDSGEMNDWDGLAVSYPMVLPVEQGYLMWYTGINTKQNGDPAMRIGTAFSKDGITWLKTSTNPVLDIGDEGEWNEASSLSPRVILDNDTWKIWFTGFDRDRIFSIGYTEKAVSGER